LQFGNEVPNLCSGNRRAELTHHRKKIKGDVNLCLKAHVKKTKSRNIFSSFVRSIYYKFNAEITIKNYYI